MFSTPSTALSTDCAAAGSPVGAPSAVSLIREVFEAVLQDRERQGAGGGHGVPGYAQLCRSGGGLHMF